ncbi:MAG TPA: ComEC/Rec2 family competence protein, partial [Cytophagaceae bacterium]|nr:ComEC/Rec2 family competence protein [Cytophagaceae bacterium]
PSVVRAVTMFSIFLIASILRRNSGIYNTLSFSAFVILCIEPQWLLDVGFQFSFMAVIGIAYISPILESGLEVKRNIVKKLISLVSLSLAAQLAVSPLSIYYFHTFPLLFLPYNLIIVPLSSLALYTGLVGLILYKIPVISSLFLWITDYIVKSMNYLVSFPLNTVYLKADFIYLNSYELVLLYITIILFFFSIKNKQYKSLVISFSFFLIFSLSMFCNSKLNADRKTFALYNVKGETVISLVYKGKAIVISDSIYSKETKNFKFNVYNHLAERRISTLIFTSFGDSNFLATNSCGYGQLLIWEGLKILRINRYDEKIKFPSAFLREINYIILSNDNTYKWFKKELINLSSTVLIDSSVKEKSSISVKDFYDVRKSGAFVFTE